MSKCISVAASAMAVAILMGASALLAGAQTAVTTYHYDNYRTGWNPNETTLTPANVKKPGFGRLETVALDDQVDGQPLVVPGVMITAGAYQGTTHDVVYVATEGNTVYAIDAHSGTVLLKPNFGTPVRYPLGCGNNGPNVGINSTPVIDTGSNTLYVMVYTQGSAPTYTLHALDLGSLTDKVAAQTVVASHTLTNGTTFNFNAKYQRQRPGLLLANGSIYAGFGSFCDFSANLSRGWLLGWTAGTLAPFPSNQLNDLQPTDHDTFFLSSIWMSGYGLAADDAGNIVFVTGNSDANSYDGVTNIQESVVKVNSTLTTVVDLFTPDNQVSLDQGDVDFGSGGVLVLPDQPGSIPHMAAAAGKDGNLYFMNEDNLGGYSLVRTVILSGGGWDGPGGGERGHAGAAVPGANFSEGRSESAGDIRVHQRRTRPRILYGDLVEWNEQPGHLGGVTSERLGQEPAVSVCLRPERKEQQDEAAFLFEGRLLAESGRELQPRPGGGERRGIRGKLQDAGDLRFGGRKRESEEALKRLLSDADGPGESLHLAFCSSIPDV